MATTDNTNYQHNDEQPEPQTAPTQSPDVTFDFDTVEDKHASTPIYELGYN